MTETKDLNLSAPSILIQTEGGRQSVKGILAVWDSGKVIWSGKQVTGGKPYFSGTIPKEQVDSIISLAKSQISGKNLDNEVSYYGPDSKFTALSITRKGEINLNWKTWHEILEANPEIVALSSGAEPLNNRSIDSLLSMQPLEFIQFRKAWQLIRESCNQILPKQGDMTSEAELQELNWDPE